MTASRTLQAQQSKRCRKFEWGEISGTANVTVQALQRGRAGREGSTSIAFCFIIVLQSQSGPGQLASVIGTKGKPGSE